MLKAPSAPCTPLFPRVRYAPPALLPMRPALNDHRRTLEAQMAELRVTITKDEEAEDMAGIGGRSTTNANATAPPPAKPAVPKGTAVVKGKATAQAGKGRGKGLPESAVVLHVPLQGKAFKKEVPDGDVALRGSLERKPQTAAEKKAAKQQHKNLFKRHCSTYGCDTWVTWDHMRSYKGHTSEDAGMASDWLYECASCMALRQNTSEREAMSEILRTSASFRSSQKRNAEFKKSRRSRWSSCWP